MTSDFRRFYRDALGARASALRTALDGLEHLPEESAAAIRRIAHSLRGSGGTYGFPEISAAAGVVEDAPPQEIAEATRRLLNVVHGTTSTATPVQRVLVVDDDPTLALVAEAVLESIGATVHVAGTGADAEAALLHNTYDLIILDLQLPDTDGRALLLRLKDREVTAHLPIAILSASTDGTTQTECYALGADAFFTKPFDPAEFAQGIGALLRRTAVAPAKAAADSSKHVVLVEDDELVSALVTHRLTRAGFEVTLFADGHVAMERIHASAPGLIILDVKIPGTDGFEVLRRLRETAAFQKTPVIMLTALGNEKDVVRAFELGASDYMTKPFSPAELLARVQRLIVAS